MSGDYSRKRFNPEKHYQGVLRQQGRVDLDADWNEYVEIEDRRWRAETIDVIGRCGVPSETPDGFKIGLSGGELTVGQGRMYVDGYLAENHGTAPAFDATIEESYGTAPLLVKDQPYGGPVTVPKPEKEGEEDYLRSLVYLDVWRREVTHLQAPDLIEPAVNIDSTTRYQTAWRVRVLDEEISQDITCETPLSEISGWPESNLPSTARLSTDTVGVTTKTDLCLIPPTGGYRGLENHLYRVEVHSATTTSVKVKWSRENAHVATNVVEILDAGTAIRVESLGRDNVLSFNNNDWVEITSDSREWAGVPGEMRSVTVNKTDLTLSFTGSLSSDLTVADHLRVIRWDQKGVVRKPDGTELINLDLTSDGLIELTPANPSFVLEHGIQATLNVLTGGTAHACDYWCFVARTADADIEHLTQAPPLGIHHHFCHLAIIEKDGKILDCRNVFPPLTELTPGCCTVVVRPGEDIQAAIDSLPESGGCVCLKVGDHLITSPIRIERSNVTLQGESSGARVVRDNGAEVLQVRHPDGLLLDNVSIVEVSFHLLTNGIQNQIIPPMIWIDHCRQAKVDGCVLHSQFQSQIVGVRISQSTDVRVSSCIINHVWYGILAVEGTMGLEVVGNTIESLADKMVDSGFVGIFAQDVSLPTRIEHNRVVGFIIGVAINDGLLTDVPFSLAAGSTIIGNYIVRAGGPLEADTHKAFGIDVAADDCIISDNILLYNSAEYGGISASGHHAVVERNHLRSFVKEVGKVHSLAILLAKLGGKAGFGSIGGRIVGNRLVGVQNGIVLYGNDGADVLDNCIESEGLQPQFGILTVLCVGTRVEGNRVTNAVSPIAASRGISQCFNDNTLLRGGGGLTCVVHTSLTCRGNRIEDMLGWGVVSLFGFGRYSFVNNRIMSCGYGDARDLSLPAIGFGASLQIGELAVESCEIMNTGVSPDRQTVSTLCWGLFADLILEARVQSNLVSYANARPFDPDQDHLDLAQEHRALYLRGLLELIIEDTDGNLSPFGFSAQVLDNKFIGPGFSALVEIGEPTEVADRKWRRFERVFFNNNFSWHFSRPGESKKRATVLMAGRSAIVMGNHFKTLFLVPSVIFDHVDDKVYMGNIAQEGPPSFGGIPQPVSSYNKP